jgi:hypothetical protein
LFLAFVVYLTCTIPVQNTEKGKREESMNLVVKCFQCGEEIDKRTTDEYRHVLLEDNDGERIDTAFHPVCYYRWDEEKKKLDSPHYGYKVLLEELVPITH